MDINIKEEKERLIKKYKKVSLIKNLSFCISYIMYITSILYVIPFVKLILILFKFDLYIIDIIGMLFEYFFTSLPLLSIVIGDIEMRKISGEIRGLSEKEEIHNLRKVRLEKEKKIQDELEKNREIIEITIDMFSSLSRREQIDVLNEMKEHRNLEQIANEAMADYLQDKFEDIIDYSGDEKNDGYTRKRIKKD